MEYREKVLSLIKESPMLPTQIAKALSTDSILAGAMLAEMAEKGLVKISKLQVGSSPVYFLPGNEAQLLQFTGNLNEKDRRTVQLLEQEKVINEADVDPLTRVSLQKVKDFAMPLIVTHDGKEARMWKWFLLSQEEAEEIIRGKLEPEMSPPPEPVSEPEQEKEAVPESAEQEEVREQLEPKPKKKVKKVKKKAIPKTNFWEIVETYLTKNGIKLLEKTMLKKTEYDMLIEVPSAVGTMTCYAKARSKKRVTDGDVSAAYVQGQIRKLPVILFIDGELTKAAKEIQGNLHGLTITQVNDGS